MTTVQTATATALPLATLAATNEAQAANIVARATSKKDATLVIGLLPLLQAMDNNKTARADVAGRALHAAYTLAAKSGNVSQIADVIASTGNKVCEKAMRKALQVVGLGIATDGTASGRGLKAMVTAEAERSKMTIDEYIDSQVNDALSIFVGIACKPAKPAKTAEEKAAAKAASDAANAAKSAELQADSDTVTLDADTMLDTMIQAIGTGVYSAEDIDRLYVAVLATKNAALDVALASQAAMH